MAKANKKAGNSISLERVLKMIVGSVLIGVAVACYRVSLFGVDAYTCMNLGLSGFLGIRFGNFSLIMNTILFVAVLFIAREHIGIGTLVNMASVGYVADFCYWIVMDIMGVQAGMFLRILFLAAASILIALGCALYMNAKLGIAPYDAIAFIIVKFMKGKISFRAARVVSDVTVVIIGVTFCLIGHNNLMEIIGLGTIVNALFNGPLIQFFLTKIEKHHS